MNIEERIQKAKEKENNRNFNQSIEMIIHLNNNEKINEVLELPNEFRIAKIYNLTNKDLKLNTREIRKLIRQQDFFIANEDVMPQIAKQFARYFIAFNKLPTKQNGLIYYTEEELPFLLERLRKSIRLISRNKVIQIAIGKANMANEWLVPNAVAVLNHLKTENIKRIIFKSSMGECE